MFNYKNASKQELKEQFKKIAKSQGERNFIISNEKYYLPKVLNILAKTWEIILKEKNI